MKIIKFYPYLYKKLLFILSFCLVLSSCATMSDSLILGIGSGAAVGAGVIRQSEDGRADNGALVGAVIGGISAYFIHKGIEKRDEKTRRETLLNLEKYDVSTPNKTNPSTMPAGNGHYLTKPVVDMEWIETQVQGDKLVEGHRVWKILEKPRWLPGSEKEKDKK